MSNAQNVALRAHPPSIVPAPDGFPLALRFFEPSLAPRAAVVIAGGTGIPQGFYAAYAERLSELGFLAVTFDYRGIGDSRPPGRRARGGMTGWVVDTQELLRTVRARVGPRLPLFQVGHSFGGQAIGLMPEAQELLDGAILIAAQSGYYGHWPLAARLRLALLWHGAVPVLVRATGRLPGWAGLGEDLPGDVALEWAKWCTTPGYLTGVVPRERQHFTRFRRPVLALAFTDDDYAPGSSIDELLGWYDGAIIEKRVHTPKAGDPRGIGHLGFFRRAHAELWTETFEWLERQVAPRGATG